MKTPVGSMLVAMLAVLVAMAGEPEKKEAATTAATRWLALVDAGKYAESWQQAAGFFRNAVKQEDWERSMAAFRKPLGDLVSRDVKEAAYMTSLPGVPDGEFVVIQFTTVFANKQAAVETVTPMLDPDGTWRVSGYFIR